MISETNGAVACSRNISRGSSERSSCLSECAGHDSSTVRWRFSAPHARHNGGINLRTITEFTYLLNFSLTIKFTACFAAGPNRQGSNCSTRGACADKEAVSRLYQLNDLATTHGLLNYKISCAPFAPSCRAAEWRNGRTGLWPRN